MLKTRIIGILLILIGLGCIIVGVIDFIVRVTNFSSPTSIFYLTFAGFPLVVVGAIFLSFSFKSNIQTMINQNDTNVNNDLDKCPLCNNDKDSGAKFCIKCGMKFIKVCKYCEKDNKIDARYCKNCGKDLIN